MPAPSLARLYRPTLRLVFSGHSIESGPAHPLSSEPVFLGRTVGPGNVELADPYVSRRHARLALSADGRALSVTDMSSTGTEVDGHRVDEGLAHDGSIVRVGDSLFVFRAEDEAEAEAEVEGFLGIAPATRRMRRTVSMIGPTPATTLLTGETGTGKEVAARALHRLSKRSGPFVAVNCAAIPHALAESQFFGHVAGSYTGARASSEGFFRAADRGTILLDEIGELPLELQAKLLRALEDRSVCPVGSTQPAAFDVRVVAATNKNLGEGVRAGTFRGDLYARLSEVVIELAPLRRRREDILLLVASALDADVKLTADLASALLLYEWPFNVRELLHVVSLVRIRAGAEKTFDVNLLDERLRPLGRPPSDRPTASAPRDRRRPEPDELAALLEKHAGLVADVARETGHSRRQVYRWLRAYGIDPAAYRREPAAK